MPKPNPLNHPTCGRAAALAGTVVALLALAGAGAAAAQALGELTRVSGGRSPFAGCKADSVVQQEGELFRRTEIEPFVAADPTDPDNLLVGYQQDRWSNGGARGDVAGISLNGGASWRTVVVPGVSRCADGEFLRASDPWVDFSPSGTAYFMSLAFDPDLVSPSGEFLGFGRNGMLVNRSTTGGRSWSDPITLIETDDPRFLNDKNSLTADPTDPSLVYAVWDRLEDFTVPPPEGFPVGGGPLGARARAEWLKRAAAAAKPAEQPQPTEVLFKGPTLFTRSTDGGKTWDEAREIYDPGPNAQTINNLIVVLPPFDGGTVIDFFTHIFSNGVIRLDLLRSFDEGASFEAAPIPVDLIFSFGTITPDLQEPVRDAAILFDVAVDPNTGVLYAVWQDVRFRGVEEVAFAQSVDNGLTWSTPIRVNQTPVDAANPLRQQAFVPSIEVGADGELVVTYYDFRNDSGENGDGELTDYWAVFCDPGAEDCRGAASWGDERRLTEQPFDMLDAPVAGGHFLGDYMGLERAGEAVYPVFGIATAPNRTDLFTRRITFGGGNVASVAP